MPYIVIEGFKDGLDKRRLEAASAPGSLTVMENAHINRGEEIVKTKGLVSKFVLPAGTFGMQALNDALFVFGSGADPGVPAGVTYQQLQHEDGGARTMTAVLGSDVTLNNTFVVAEFDNGDVRPFFNGVIIAGFLTGSGAFSEDLVVNGAMLTYKNKVYMASGTDMLFSGSGVPGSYDDSGADGSGLIDISSQSSNETNINGYAEYQNNLAVFSDNNITIWATDPDPTAYFLTQNLRNVGTVASGSVISYGEADVFFLSRTGLRSIKAINSSLAAGVSDVGTPIDDLLIAAMASLTDAQISAAVSGIEPIDGRFLLALSDTVYAFSFFFASKISAWSTWKPGFVVSRWAKIADRLYARSGNTIYLYGGDNNDEFTTEKVTIELPYLDGRRIADWKFWTALDFIVEGTWTVSVNVDPNNSNYWIETAVITEHTIAKDQIDISQYGPLFKMKFEHTGAADESARISKVIAHYKTGKAT